MNATPPVCKDKVPLPECDDNQTLDTSFDPPICVPNCDENQTLDRSVTPPVCKDKEPECDLPDTSFPQIPANYREAFVWGQADPDRSSECMGKIQTRRADCHDLHRCLVYEECPPDRSREDISSYVTPRDGGFHEDIPLDGVDFGLHYASLRRDDTTIAHGWLPSIYARLDGKNLYTGNGENYIVTAKDEEGYRVVTRGASQLLFDANGTLQSIRDLYTKETQTAFGYDNVGRLVTLTDIYGEISTLERDANGTVTAIVAPTGQRTLLSIDDNGDLIEVQYEDTSSYTFEYERHLMTVETEPKGNRFLHFYDDAGHVVKVIDAEQGEWRFGTTTADTYGSHTITRAGGDVVIYKNHFLENNTTLKTEKILPTGDTVLYENSIDDSMSSTTSCGMKTTNIYKKNADGTLYKDPYTHRRVLESTTVTTPSGLQKFTTIEKRYRVDDNGTLKNVYTATTTNAKRYKAKRDYLHHYAWQISPLGKTITTHYDSRNVNLLSIKPYAQYKTTYTYDDKGRVTKAKTGFRTTAYSYDARGNMESMTDPLGRTTHYSYDSRDRLTEVT